jgi:hypothetical protein
MVEGDLQETFTSTAGKPLSQRQLGVGSVVGFEPTHVHHVANHRSAHATSVHIYNRPLATLTYYRLDRDGQLRPSRLGPPDEPHGALALTDIPLGPDGRLAVGRWSRELVPA